MITKEILDERYTYDLSTGAFFHKKRSGRPNGKIKEGARAGNVGKRGYRVISINYRDYQEHHLSWFYVRGTWPDIEKRLDHINQIKTDNRIGNLREVTHSENAVNSKINSRNTSGYRGVSWNKQAQKYLVQICVNNKRRRLGYYKSVEVAALVALVAQIDAWGDKVAIHNK